jgi:hypothetical protein
MGGCFAAEAADQIEVKKVSYKSHAEQGALAWHSCNPSHHVISLFPHTFLQTSAPHIDKLAGRLSGARLGRDQGIKAWCQHNHKRGSQSAQKFSAVLTDRV